MACRKGSRESACPGPALMLSSTGKAVEAKKGLVELFK